MRSAARLAKHVFVEAVGGSGCTLSEPPLCPAPGVCLASVEVVGSDCVLLVRGTARDGQPFEPYCFRLGSLGGTRAADTIEDLLWDRCAHLLGSR